MCFVVYTCEDGDWGEEWGGVMLQKHFEASCFVGVLYSQLYYLLNGWLGSTLLCIGKL